MRPQSGASPTNRHRHNPRTRESTVKKRNRYPEYPPRPATAGTSLTRTEIHTSPGAGLTNKKNNGNRHYLENAGINPPARQHKRLWQALTPKTRESTVDRRGLGAGGGRCPERAGINPHALETRTLRRTPPSKREEQPAAAPEPILPCPAPAGINRGTGSLHSGYQPMDEEKTPLPQHRGSTRRHTSRNDARPPQRTRGSTRIRR